ncbi:MAG: tetratricopeptide repeat protein [Candidatus Omnitrophota bacterium]
MKTQESFINAVYIALILLLGAALYTNTVDGRFLCDDHILISDNMYMRNWEDLPKLLTEDWGSGSGIKYSFYRPLTMLSFFVVYRFAGNNPAPYHLVNIAVHCLSALALYWLANIFLSNRLAASLAALFFIAHPVQTEAVAYASATGDSLALLFILVSFAAYLKNAETGKGIFYASALLAFMLSLMSKESGLVLPAVILAYHAVFRRKFNTRAFLPFILVACSYLTLRCSVLNSTGIDFAQLTTAWQRIPGFFAAIAGYIRLLIFPVNLHMDYGNPIFTFSDYKVPLGVVITIALIVSAYAMRRRDKLFTFSIIWFFIFLLPVSNIHPLAFFMAEHYLYIPSVIFFILLGRVCSTLSESGRLRYPAMLGIIVILSVWSFATIRQNEFWKTPAAIYGRILKFNPKSHIATFNLATDKAASGNPEEAISLYKKALELRPDYADPYLLMADIYINDKNYDKALNLLEDAVSRHPGHTGLLCGLARAHYAKGDNDAALRIYHDALAMDAGDTNALSGLGVIYLERGEAGKALSLFKRAAAVNSRDKTAFFNLGTVYGSTGRNVDAITAYRRALEIDPGYSPALNNLAYEYATSGNRDEAVRSFGKILEADPHNADAHNNLAVLLYYTGDHASARRHCRIAVRLGCDVDPEFSRLVETHAADK